MPKHSSPILNINAAPRAEMRSKASGLVAIQAAANRLTMTRGPSVNIGAAAVHKPARRPPERVSRITIVSNGPGLIPSTTPSVAPATARARIGSISNISTP